LPVDLVGPGLLARTPDGVCRFFPADALEIPFLRPYY
jgi:hypothetical protein